MPELPSPENQGGEYAWQDLSDEEYQQFIEDLSGCIISDFPGLVNEVSEITLSTDSSTEKFDLLAHLYKNRLTKKAEIFKSVEIEAMSEWNNPFLKADPWAGLPLGRDDQLSQKEKLGRRITKAGMVIGVFSVFGVVIQDYNQAFNSGCFSIMVYQTGRILSN